MDLNIMQSLKDIKSKNQSSLKVDGSVRTVAGTFAIASNQITGLPIGNKIEAGDRIDLTYITTATQIEVGLSGAADLGGLAPGFGLFRIDKSLSQFATIGAVEAAFTAGLGISFQSGILAGASCIITDTLGPTAFDGAMLGDGGYWLVAFELSTAIGFPPLTVMTFPPPLDGTDYTTISPSIAIFTGVAGPQSLNGLVVSSVISPTSIEIEQTIPNVASFTDVSVTKHSRVADTLITEDIEAKNIMLTGAAGGSVVSQEYAVPFTGPIDDFTILWRGRDNNNIPISSDRPETDELIVTDPFNINVDINIIQLLSHPTSKDIAIMLYQDLSNNNIYIKCFKYTYELGFDNVYTPYLLSGADSTEIRMGFSTMVNRVDQQINTTSPLDPILFVFGGKASPGTAVYGAALKINPTTLVINDSGLSAWGNTGTVTAVANTQIFKIADMKQIIDSSQDDRMVVLVQDPCLSLVTYNTFTNTWGMSWSLNDLNFCAMEYDYHGNNGSDIYVVKQESVTRINGTPGLSYPISKSNFSRSYKSYTGVLNGHVTLFKVDVNEGVGGETFTYTAGTDLSLTPRSHVNYVSFPQNFQNGSQRYENMVFEVGQDKLLFFKSYGYYILFDRATAKPIYIGRVPNDGFLTITKNNLFTICVNDTVVHWNSSQWKTTKFLTDGPHLAYKKRDVNTAVVAANHSKINVDFVLEEGKTYYWSYFDNQISTLPKIGTEVGLAPTKIGTAIGPNTFLVDFNQEQIPGAVRFQEVANVPDPVVYELVTNSSVGTLDSVSSGVDPQAIISFTGTGNNILNGITGGTTGRRITVKKINGGTLKINHFSSLVYADHLKTNSTLPIILGEGESIDFIYDGSIINWVQVSSGIIQNKNNVVTSYSAPTTSDDSTKGYGVGSTWIFIPSFASQVRTYICRSNSVGAAVWKERKAVTVLTSYPSSSHDSNAGFEVGDLVSWEKNLYRCESATPSIAIWTIAYAAIKNASVDPTVTDDANLGFAAGNIWINDGSPKKSFILIDAAPGNAVWMNLNTNLGRSLTVTTDPNIFLEYYNNFIVQPTANINLSLSNPRIGDTYVFVMKPGSTPFTITFSNPNIKWKGGTVYAANTANATDIVTLYYDGTNYYGNFGEDYA